MGSHLGGVGEGVQGSVLPMGSISTMVQFCIGIGRIVHELDL